MKRGAGRNVFSKVCQLSDGVQARGVVNANVPWSVVTNGDDGAKQFRSGATASLAH